MSNAKIYSLKRQETRHRTHIDSMNRQETRHRTQTDSLNRQDTMNSTQTDSLNRQDTMNSTQTDSLNRQDTMNSTQTDSMNRQNTINSTTIYNYGFLMRWTSIIVSLWRVENNYSQVDNYWCPHFELVVIFYFTELKQQQKKDTCLGINTFVACTKLIFDRSSTDVKEDTLEID